MVPVSNGTLLRVVRRRVCFQTDGARVVGVDDWALRRNHRYGTIVYDLEWRRIVTLLRDRDIATVEARLADHPQIDIVSRDRGGGYREAAARALPHVIQVADRWHPMENASAAFLDAVRKSMRSIRNAIGAPRSTSSCSPAPRDCNMKDTCGVQKPTTHSSSLPARAFPSKRSCAAPVTAESSSARPSAARRPTYSA
jgi:transposase